MKKKKMISIRIDGNEEKNLQWISEKLGESRPEVLRTGIEILDYIITETIANTGEFEPNDIIRILSKV